MDPGPNDAQKAREVFAALDVRLDSDPPLARRVLEALKKAESPRPSNRRKPAPLDPVAVYRRDQAALRPALKALTLDQLKDIVAQYAMDPRKLALKWKTSERLVELIVSVTEQRASKGDAFRS